MHTPSPVHCRPEAYALFSESLPRLETGYGLLMAAVAISMHDLLDVDPGAVDRSLQTLTDTVKTRINGHSDSAKLAHAHQLLFDEVGLCGHGVDYDDPAASYLSLVLERRCGLPIALCLIYKTVLDRLGLRVFGVNAPGHFMISVEMHGKAMIVDPFDRGRALSEEEARCRSAEAVGRALHAPDAPLALATHRDWVRRMLRNLHGVFLRAGRADDVSAMIELGRLV